MKVHIDDDAAAADDDEQEEEEDEEEMDVMILELFLFCGSSYGTCKLHRRGPLQILLLQLP